MFNVNAFCDSIPGTFYFRRIINQVNNSANWSMVWYRDKEPEDVFLRKKTYNWVPLSVVDGPTRLLRLGVSTFFFFTFSSEAKLSTIFATRSNILYLQTVLIKQAGPTLQYNARKQHIQRPASNFDPLEILTACASSRCIIKRWRHKSSLYAGMLNSFG